MEGPPSRAQCVREAQDAATLLAREGMEVPESPISTRRNQSIQRWESGLTVGNFTHQLLATGFAPLQLSCEETTCSAGEFRTLLLVRLHLPLHMGARFCKCGEMLDVYGHHRSACSRVGLLKPRGSAVEVCMARICREAGARVKENQLLRDLNIEAQADDQRRIEVIANGLPFWGGKQVAIDTTVVSALTGRGVARGSQARACHPRGGTGQAPEVPGVAHWDQVPFPRDGIRGGRTVEPQRRHVLEEFGLVQVSLVPRVLRRSTQLLFFQRWTALLACSIQRAYAASLLGSLWVRALV